VPGGDFNDNIRCKFLYTKQLKKYRLTGKPKGNKNIFVIIISFSYIFVSLALYYFKNDGLCQPWNRAHL
jgi:hypothetical protein